MEIEEQIGKKIRDLRNQNGLTQEELADRTELTKGYISQLERGQTAPSVGTLMDIVECLGTNLSEFFREEEDRQIVYRKEDYFEKEEENGNTVTWLIASAQSREVEPILMRICPGEESFEDKPHEGEEFGYVLEGKVDLYYGDDVYRVRTGDSFIYSADRNHKLVSVGKRDALILWVSTPPSF